MVTVRRWYIFLVCAISLQAVTWAVILLLRNLFGSGLQQQARPLEEIAVQLAVVLVGLPVFLLHWLWAQALARRDPEERSSVLRSVYLYGTLAGLASPFLANLYSLAGWSLSLLPRFTFSDPLTQYGTFSNALAANLSAVVVLGVLAAYHAVILRQDLQAGVTSEAENVLRRLFVYAFAGVGLGMLALGSIHGLRWLLLSLQPAAMAGSKDTADLAKILVGLPLWLVLWRKGERLFQPGQAGDSQSALRRFYLYAVVFVSTLAVALQASFLLAALLMRLLALPIPPSRMGPLPVILIMGILWLYHSRLLQQEAAETGDAPRQAGVRRLFLYLMASVGLGVFLAGLSGNLSVLIRLFAETFGSSLREQLAWFSAALLVGLPIWLLAWRPLAQAALDPTSQGEAERLSVVRKIYLYFFMFAATLAVLVSLVYILSRLISLALGVGGEGSLLVDLGQAIAFSIVAAGVWVYHFLLLRQDAALKRQEKQAQLAGWRLALVDAGNGSFARALLEELRRELPGLPVDPIGLTREAAAALQSELDDIPARLAAANLIVGPADIAFPCAGDGSAAPDLAQQIIQGPARRLLVPVHRPGLDWAGVDRWDEAGLVRQTVLAVRQAVNDEHVRAVRPWSFLSIVGLVLGVLFLASIVLPSLLVLIFGG